MTRVLSAVVLLPVILAVIWYLPPVWTLGLAGAVLALAVLEYAELASRMGAPVSRLAVLAGALATGAAVSLAPSALPLVMMIAVTSFAVLPQVEPDRSVFPSVCAAAFALLYLALPLGVMAMLRDQVGRESVILLLATIMASDTAQYYGGRAVGRRPLAPAVSPNKTIEGACFGLVAGLGVMTLVGHWWLPAIGLLPRAALGSTLAGLGIAGDLFESSLKRSADLKDASSLIPGHGGILDRVDGLLFAIPAYAAVVLSTSTVSG